MIVTDKKIKVKHEWHEQHTLSPDQLKQLIKEKIERARAYHEADKLREAVLLNRR